MTDTKRLLKVAEPRLTGRACIMGDQYTTATIAPWIHILSGCYEAVELLGNDGHPYVGRTLR